jgi:glycosyltransferase involved in cell wall biosynthesis
MVCLSNELYRRCMDDPALREDQLVCIPNGVDTEEFMPVDSATQRTLRQSLSIPPDRPVVIYVGILAHRKGTDILLRAWQRVLRQRPEAVLLLVGPVEDTHNAFADEVAERLPNWVEACSPDSVVITGRVENVAAYLRAADVFVLPSRSEGLPNVLLEAMSTGLACVGARISGITDVVSDGVDALLFDSENEEELAVCLLRLLDDTLLRAKLGRTARQTVESHFSLASVAQAYQELYRELVEE